MTNKRYTACRTYNYYDGPTQFTATALDEHDLPDIYWLHWDEELEDDSRTFRVYRLSGTEYVGQYIETVHENDIDFTGIEPA